MSKAQKNYFLLAAYSEELGEREDDERAAGHDHEHDGDEETEEGRVLGLVTKKNDKDVGGCRKHATKRLALQHGVHIGRWKHGSEASEAALKKISGYVNFILSLDSLRTNPI